MKKLLLTSDALTSENLRKEFLKLLEKQVSDIKVLVMYTVQKKEDEKYLDYVKDELNEIGIIKENIIYANISEDITAEEFSNDADVVYSCGGNTYYILDRVKKTGFNNLINEFVEDGGLYLGVSAGSIIMGEDIKVAGFGGSQGDQNDIGLENLEGLNLTDISVIPHYHDDFKNDVEDFKSQVEYPVEALRDGEALLILGNQVNKISKL
jgi:dipeptidase E